MYKIPAKTLFAGQKLIYVPECHSTNSSLAELNNTSELPEGTVFITDNQTQGRGQRGNAWIASKGENLTFSMLLRPGFLAVRSQFRLNMAVSLGVISALADYVQAGLAIKWPNDIMIGDRKVGGILIENQSQGERLTSSVVGIGLNVNQQQFPFASATSLCKACGHNFELNEVYQRTIVDLESRYVQLREGAYPKLNEDYHAALYKRGVPQTFESESQQFGGVITGVHDSGMLCISIDGKERRFSLKEVSIVIPSGVGQ